MEISYNRTKIVATVGPASNSEGMLESLIREGVDVFRLNFSHGTHDVHQDVINKINKLNDKLGTHVSKLQDLQGPKIRVEAVKDNGVEIKEGDTLTITTDAPDAFEGTAEKISTGYENLAKDVNKGDTILIDDGNLELKVLETDGVELKAEIIYGGILKSRKGINLPNSTISAPSMTEKDKKDLLFGLEAGVDWIALSFVRTADCIRDLRKIINEHNKKCKIVAKIEKPEAVANIDEIIEETDGIMVARGDLGVEIKAEDVPMIQKKIIEKCNALGKPVIVATQMVESMIENPRPTRAEVNDVANAVLDGADAVMLSAETAAGKYPLEAVRTMTHTIDSIERQADHIFYKLMDFDHEDSPTFYYDNVVSSACVLANVSDAHVITGITRSGYTAMQITRHRPKADIFIFTDQESLLPQLNLLWGVRSIYYDKDKSISETINDFKEILKKEGYLKEGDIFIHTSAMPRGENLRTNMMKLTVVD